MTWQPPPQYPYWDSWIRICPGDWLMWVMPAFVRVGQVEYVEGISLVLKLQGDSYPIVIPNAYDYWNPNPPTPAPEYTLHRTPEPTHRVDPVTGETMTIKQAAAKLGTTPKDVRRLLRTRTLQGIQKDGRWLEVTAASVARHRQGASPSTG